VITRYCSAIPAPYCNLAEAGSRLTVAMSRRAVLLLSLPVLVSVQAAAAQDGVPGFAVDSIKRCEGAPDLVGSRARDGGAPSRLAPTRIDLPCQPLRALIQIAYIRSHFRATGVILQLEDGPGWLDSDRYQVSAVADRPVAPELMEGTMLQSLLQERFHLRTHREARETQVYAMTVAKGGFKIKPAAPGSCVTDDTPASGKPVCGELTMARNSSRFRFTLTSGTVTDLARFLGSRLGRPVLDKTSLAGKYDFHVEFAPEGAEPSADGAVPSIFAALADLGLKLETARGTREFLVIDHVEKPSAN
jgi:uncharacterized protein (TIGR03435 family)